jgi:mono/diheme cytochrome c family protein
MPNGMLLALGLIMLAPLTTAAQGGEVIYQTLCAACHTGSADESTPRVDSLRLLDAKTIVDSLTSGTMRTQGEALNAEQKIQVAEYLAAARASRRGSP